MARERAIVEHSAANVAQDCSRGRGRLGDRIAQLGHTRVRSCCPMGEMVRGGGTGSVVPTPAFWLRRGLGGNAPFGGPVARTHHPQCTLPLQTVATRLRPANERPLIVASPPP